MASVGGESYRDGGGLPNLSGRLTPGNAGLEQAQPAGTSGTGDKPSFTPEDLAHISSDGVETDTSEEERAAPNADPLAAIDVEDRAKYARLLQNGTFTPEELQRAYNLTDGELEAIRNPPKPMSKARIEAELAEIAAVRRDDSRAYWRDAKLQGRERELLGLLEKARAAPAAEVEKPAEPDAIEKELAEISSLRKSGSKDYWSAEVQAREQELLQARADAQSFASGEAAVRVIVDAVLGSVEDAEGFQAGFDEMFDGLSEEAQASMREALRATPEDPVKLLPEQKLADYAALGPETQKQVAAWGKDALRTYTRANARLNAMIEQMSDADAQRATAYLSGLSPAEKAAVIGALAGGGQ